MKRALLFAVVFVAGFGMATALNWSQRNKTRAWLAEPPHQVQISYPSDKGRTGHILKVNRIDTIHPEAKFDSSAWRISLTNESGVWYLECDKIGENHSR